jgi:hypothetical protein
MFFSSHPDLGKFGQEFEHSGVLDSSNVPNCRVCDEVRDLDVNWFHYLNKMVADHKAILRSEKNIIFRNVEFQFYLI